MSNEYCQLLLKMFRAAVDAAAPALSLPAHLPSRPKGRTIVVGAGKAAASMAAAVEAHWSGPLEGIVVTRYGHASPCDRIEVIEASHPVPDESGQRAGKKILRLVSGLSSDDLVIALFSGGGSALLTVPLEKISLEELQYLNSELLQSGAAIDEINCVRRHVNALAGGRLAAACYPAKVVGLLISDVPGDEPINIASGPTTADPTTCADALAILERFSIVASRSVMEILSSSNGESIKSSDCRLKNVENKIVAASRMSLIAAAQVARQCDITPHILSDRIQGEARHVGTVLAGIARHIADYGQPFQAPCVVISGGETTVRVQGKGRGGRNTECLLGMGIALENHPRIFGIAADTDGIDGVGDIAGALWRPNSQMSAVKAGLHPRQYLENNDSHTFFERLGDHVVTGPTMTNVNDFRAILIAGQ